jgi:RNA polymerase sigma-70 factor (ECF subfamily)
MRSIEPYPDVFVGRIADVSPGPEARYDTRKSIALAFIAGLQRLPPRQRAVLLLRDVLGFRAAEVAEMLDMGAASVDAALLSARARLEAGASAACGEPAPPPSSPRERALAKRFADAFEAGDLDGIVALLSADARLTSPPEPLEYRGPAAIRAFLDSCSWWGATGFRLIPTRANAQPAFGCYLADAYAPIAWAHGLLVLTLGGERIAAITRFRDNSLHPQFGLPRTLRGF